ncbi:MAG: alpha/beta fold hydrolase [Rhodospirillaceae bacterium]|jgi:dipeptidyl aminopeptidase/acylaminoacyl peptidase|nr:alpha/beta fold hydrolase [Rhodospirillales bacterium]MBT3904153.1 alpha/beta fold hydrolase [Rhodospirillaceae bacterium]MBT4699917.1 alpha/beta fold hydrolase [Rhodospirillaceae bacterium]MBT5035447.1 alpha/beta fold hydrolase [Rhodospirillaceae bacterium]MBT6218589.1 alpha/beta fold hydrolase [Rhodospirillaceae bacterium]
MAKDPRVELAVAHWGGRFVSNGVPLADFQEVTAGLDRWEDWCAGFSERAALHEKMGRDALAQKLFISAGEHLTRAAVLYHFAKYLFVIDLDQMKAAHMKAVDCHKLALPYLDPPAERVKIPYEGSTIYGNLRIPKGVDTPPILIMCMGLDSTKEEMGANEANYLRRGMATLAFDGPGQGEGEYDWPIRPDYEAVVTAVCDFVETRDDVDAERMGVWGVSMGGYYAPRAAAFEKRLKACISLSGPFDFGERWDAFPPMSKDTFRVRAQCETLEDAADVAAKLSLVDVAKNITCPLFVVTGELDRLFPYTDAERLAREASGPTELLIVERGGHVANNRRYVYDAATSDWMAVQLGVRS